MDKGNKEEKRRGGACQKKRHPGRNKKGKGENPPAGRGDGGSQGKTCRKRREESFSYAADSFLFPKKELAESGKMEQEEGQKLKKEKAKKVQQRIRLKKTEE